ncbi:MAG: L-threonylcarbamoyladenylate synthase [Bacteroidota bacterium]|nr:L-threonylcarbamoyladenylate synthase [Bacteroidota bacterium]
MNMMLTKLLKVEDNREHAINEAVSILKNSEIIVFPTETVYGIGCSIYDELSINRIYEIKGRSAEKPLAAHVSSIDMIKDICQDLPDAFFALADKFLPGALSVILNAKSKLPESIRKKNNTVSVRYPDNEITLEIINKLGEPLAATSANISGMPSSRNASEADAYFNGVIAAIIDGGACRFGIESTILSLTDDSPKVLREGFIKIQDIENVLNRKLLYY